MTGFAITYKFFRHTYTMTPKDTGDFLGKLKAVGVIPKEKILIPADVLGLYLSIPHDGGLEALC